MSKQATPPPPGDKSRPTAPPPPPTWRNWLWPIMIFAIVALWLFLPTRSSSTSLSYSQFLSDVSTHQVKSVELAGTPGGTSSGTLTDGKTFTVVVPPQAGEELLTRSDLDWTIVYATGLDKARAGQAARIVGPGEKVSMGNGIARADVAAFMLAELASPARRRGTVVITAK